MRRVNWRNKTHKNEAKKDKVKNEKWKELQIIVKI